LQVALDRIRGSHAGVIWILAEIPAGAPLPQQIPALIQSHLDRLDAAIDIWTRLAAGPLLEEPVFFLHQVPNVR
jgi:hypothetical protein